MPPTPVILITGASSGLGAALALEHAAQGHSLVLCARRKAQLAQVAAAARAAGAPQVAIVPGDVSLRSTLDAAVRAAKRLGGLDAAYANAGYSQSGPLQTLSLSAWRRQMAVNVEGALHTLQAALPLLQARQGRLALIGSVVGYGSLSDSGAYAASKAALRAMAQVLHLEQEPLGVSVTLVTAGYFASEIRLKDADGRPDPRAKEYVSPRLLGDTAKVAAQVRQAVWAGKRELVTPAYAKLAVFLLRHFPGLVQGLAQGMSKRRLERRKAVQGR